MANIISEERYQSLYRKHVAQYEYLAEKFPEDKAFKKLKRTVRIIKSLYGRDKVYAVKQLNFLERVQVTYTEERRALIVQMIELLQKLILHKKLGRPKD